MHLYTKSSHVRRQFEGLGVTSEIDRGYGNVSEPASNETMHVNYDT